MCIQAYAAEAGTEVAEEPMEEAGMSEEVLQKVNIMIPSFWTDRSLQTVQTLIRLWTDRSLQTVKALIRRWTDRSLQTVKILIRLSLPTCPNT